MKLLVFLMMLIAGPSSQVATDASDTFSAEDSSISSVNANTFVIESVAFPNVFLRMDGNGVTKPVGPGGGKVNCQFNGTGAYEQFYIDKRSDGTYNIRSKQFSNVCLRMNAPANQVNCQYGGSGAYEKFRLVPQGGNVYGIESVQFPGHFLRMDGNGVTKPVGPGGGIVNVQTRCASYEKFRIYSRSNPRLRPGGDVSANNPDGGRGGNTPNGGRSGNNSNNSGGGVFGK